MTDCVKSGCGRQSLLNNYYCEEHWAEYANQAKAVEEHHRVPAVTAAFNRYYDSKREKKYHTQTREEISMIREFRTYVSEHRDWLFTIAILFIIDHYFLGGVLKEKLTSILHKRVEKLDSTT